MRIIILMTFLLLGWGCSADEEGGSPEVQLGEFTDVRDRITYRCVTIGSQVWMAENLRYRLSRGAFDGCLTWKEKIPELSTKEFVELVDEYWLRSKLDDGLWSEIRDLQKAGFSYEEIIGQMGDRLPEELLLDFYKTVPNEEFAEQYGYLYSYEAAQQAIPEGWRLPADEDWQELERALGMPQGDIVRMNVWRGNGQGELLKAGGIGFDALMSGGKLFGSGEKVDVYSRQGANAYFWSSSVMDDTDSTRVCIVRSVGLGESGILRFLSETKGTAYSIRCVKNKED